MRFITKEQIEKITKNDVIQLDELIDVIQNELGVRLIEENGKDRVLTEEQKKKMTKAIFSNEVILRQLRLAAAKPDYIESDEEALRIIHEARDAR